MKVSVVLKLSRSFWSLPASLVGILTLALGLSLPTLTTVNVIRADDATTDEDEEEDPLAKLTGLLDPSLAKPLMDVTQEKDFRGRHEQTYMRTALKSLSPNNKVEEQIKNGVQFRVYRLTMPENWPYMGNRTKDLVNDLDVFADGAPRARELAAREAVKSLDELIFSTDQPAFVKINAVWLLGRLNIESINRRTKTPAKPYAGAYAPLVKVLDDTNQDLDVKIAAVNGLERILEDGDPSRQQRDEISKALELEAGRIDTYVSGDGRDWYLWRLVDALGSVEFPRTMTQQTYVVDTLWQTMHDDTLPWRIRTRAARSLGQLRLDSTFNIPLLMHEIVLLAGKMTFAYNQNPNFSYWRACFSDLYFAFKAQEPEQQQKGWGLMQSPPAGAKAIVEGAYQQVLPLVNGVLKNEKPEKVSNSLLTDASTWMKANDPADKKIHQQAKPLTEAKPAPVEDPASPSTDNTQPVSEAVTSGP